jgi:hypothetical protein
VASGPNPACMYVSMFELEFMDRSSSYNSTISFFVYVHLKHPVGVAHVRPVVYVHLKHRVGVAHVRPAKAEFRA